MMRREENLRPAVLVATLAAAVLGFALRLWQLRQGRDENGLWLGGSASVLALLALCVIAIVAFWLLSRRAAPRAGITPVRPYPLEGGSTDAVQERAGTL